MYTEEFKDFVDKGIKTKQYIGLGNPNADILFVGKEPNYSREESSKKHEENASEWRKHILNNTQQVNSYFIKEDHELRENWHARTWNKYQILKSHIYDEKVKSYCVDFLENIFTTEINNSHSKNTATADRSSLSGRKLFLKESKFIQQFSVVVLACSDYIVNDDKVREIDETFGVTYIGDEKGKHAKYSKGNWFYLHYNEDETKLVIHTRQLSCDVDSKMLKDLGEIIREHLERNGLLGKTQ